MMLSTEEWHARFSIQARWTRPLRGYLFPQAGLQRARRVLDVGCGTGALQAELIEGGAAQVHGLDIDSRLLAEAAKKNLVSLLGQGDAHALPYASGSFDLSLCHFLLLWVADPYQVLLEMRRVTRPGGALLVLAEPDYGGRIDFPEELAELGRLQAESLRQQGAEPQMGRRIMGLMAGLGLESLEVGVLGAQWGNLAASEVVTSEWNMLHHDLAGQLSEAQLAHLRQLDEEAWSRGSRVLYVPTFYAWGRVST